MSWGGTQQELQKILGVLAKLTGLRAPEHWFGSSCSSSPRVFTRRRDINFSLCVNEATHGPQMYRGSGEGKLSHATYSQLQWSLYRAALRVEEKINRKAEQREIWMIFVMFTLRISTALWYSTVALNWGILGYMTFLVVTTREDGTTGTY